MNRSRAKELYGKTGEQLFVYLASSLKEGDVLGAPADKLKNALELKLGVELENYTELVKFMRIFLTPLAEVHLRTRKGIKKIFLVKKGCEEDFKKALKKEKDNKYGDGSGVKCIRCGSRFDYFLGRKGRCETRYRNSGRTPDSLVLCPSCLRKRKLEMDGEVYYKRGHCPKTRVASSGRREYQFV